MHPVNIDLAFVAFLDMYEEIIFTGQPIISRSQDFSIHSMSIVVSSKGSFMYFLNEHVYVVSIHASE